MLQWCNNYMEEVEARNNKQYYNDLLKTPFYPSPRWIATKKVNGEIDVVIEDPSNNKYMSPTYTVNSSGESEVEVEGERKSESDSESESESESDSDEDCYC